MNEIVINKPNETVILDLKEFDMQNLATQDFTVVTLSPNTTVINKMKGNPNFYIGAPPAASGSKVVPPAGGLFLSKLYQDGIDFNAVGIASITLKYFYANYYLVVGLSA